MDLYELIITPDASADMMELRNYIAEVLLAPGTALAYIETIEKEIKTLSTMPARYKLIDKEPEHSNGIRRLMVKNFFVYYHIDVENRRVYILNVIYARRDQLKALTEKTSDPGAAAK